MNLIENDEKENFHAVLVARNLSADDFSLKELDTTDPKTDEILALKGFVTVTRKSTQKQAQYPIGDGSIWVSEFQRDLDDGLFN